MHSSSTVDWHALHVRERERREELEEKLRQLGEADCEPPVGLIDKVRSAFTLTSPHAKLLLIFAENELVTKQVVHRSYPTLDPSGNSVPVMIAQLRPQIRSHGLTIINHYKRGWSLSGEHRERVRKAYVNGV
jgi:hypothetical protein